MTPILNISVSSIGHLTVFGKTFLGVVPLRYLPLKMVFLRAVVLGELPLTMHF
jgi:hypothetical protein